jgi:hypothetical protein
VPTSREPVCCFREKLAQSPLLQHCIVVSAPHRWLRGERTAIPVYWRNTTWQSAYRCRKWCRMRQAIWWTSCGPRSNKRSATMIEVVQAFDRAPITRLESDDAAALDRKRLFATSREISVCVRLRGGPERTRTANQTIISYLAVREQRRSGDVTCEGLATQVSSDNGRLRVHKASTQNQNLRSKTSKISMSQRDNRKSCHSDQYLARPERAAPTVSPTDWSRSGRH